MALDAGGGADAAEKTDSTDRGGSDAGGGGVSKETEDRVSEAMDRARSDDDGDGHDSSLSRSDRSEYGDGGISTSRGSNDDDDGDDDPSGSGGDSSGPDADAADVGAADGTDDTAEETREAERAADRQADARRTDARRADDARGAEAALEETAAEHPAAAEARAGQARLAEAGTEARIGLERREAAREMQEADLHLADAPGPPEGADAPAPDPAAEASPTPEEIAAVEVERFERRQEAIEVGPALEPYPGGRQFHADEIALIEGARPGFQASLAARGIEVTPAEAERVLAQSGYRAVNPGAPDAEPLPPEIMEALDGRWSVLGAEFGPTATEVLHRTATAYLDAARRAEGIATPLAADPALPDTGGMMHFKPAHEGVGDVTEVYADTLETHADFYTRNGLHRDAPGAPERLAEHERVGEMMERGTLAAPVIAAAPLAVGVAPTAYTAALANPMGVNQTVIAGAEIAAGDALGTGTLAVPLAAAGARYGDDVVETVADAISAARRSADVRRAPAREDLDPDRIAEFQYNHEQRRVDLAEGIGGARAEAVLDAPVRPPGEDDLGVDLIVGDRPTSLKGPMLNSATGADLPVSDAMVAGLARAVLKDIRFNTATNDVIVDTINMSPVQRDRLIDLIDGGIRAAGATKNIIYVE